MLLLTAATFSYEFGEVRIKRMQKGCVYYNGKTLSSSSHPAAKRRKFRKRRLENPI
jgi:hypothetical protein